MKNILLITLICLTSISFGRRGLGPFPYTILADSIESAVPVGFCLVKGFAYNNNVGVPNGKVSTLNGKFSTMTDSLGEYKLLIPSTDTSIFFFKSQYNEVVVWSYNFQSQHVVTLNFNSSANDLMKVSAKPVIYLYSQEELDVTIDLDYHGDLTFTYPQLKENWNVQLNQNGIMYDGKKYPYLFWEGESNHLAFNKNDNGSIPGEIVSKDNVIDHLENSLIKLGLNDTEKTDFISFWGPRMTQTEFVLVQFVVDSEYAKQIAELHVNPRPDNVRRVYMYFSSFEIEPKFETTPQDMNSFNREGFTIVEWGGTEIESTEIKL